MGTGITTGSHGGSICISKILWRVPSRKEHFGIVHDHKDFFICLGNGQSLHDEDSLETWFTILKSRGFDYHIY
jgi:hypothetical protein